MKVIFLEEVENVAKAGDVREVKNGYARNYLFPKQLAALATQDQMNRVEALKRAEALRQDNAEARAALLAPKLEGLSVSLEARSGPTGRLYGSINASTLAKAVSQAVGEDVGTRDVLLDEPIKAVGSYEVTLGLGMEIDPVIRVEVVEAEPVKPKTKRKARASKVVEEEATGREVAAAAEPIEEAVITDSTEETPAAEVREEIVVAESTEESDEAEAEEAPAAEVEEGAVAVELEEAVAEAEAVEETLAAEEEPGAQVIEEAPVSEAAEEVAVGDAVEEREENAVDEAPTEETAAPGAVDVEESGEEEDSSADGNEQSVKESAAAAAVRRAKRRQSQAEQ